MALGSELRTWWRAITGKVQAGDFVGPQGRTLSIPNDIPLQLNFPPGVSTAYARVVYTLRREGQQCYCNLRLLTGLGSSDLRTALVDLLHEKRITRHVVDHPLARRDDEKMNSFSLDR